MVNFMEPPVATLLIFFVNLALATGISLAEKKLVDVEEMKRVMKRVKEWNQKYREALKKKDQRALEKLLREQREISMIQFKFMSRRMVFSVPSIIVFWVLLYAYDGATVARLPFYIPFQVAYVSSGNSLNFISWFILTSLVLYSVVQKLLGISYYEM